MNKGLLIGGGLGLGLLVLLGGYGFLTSSAPTVKIGPTGASSAATAPLAPSQSPPQSQPQSAAAAASSTPQPAPDSTSAAPSAAGPAPLVNNKGAEPTKSAQAVAPPATSQQNTTEPVKPQKALSPEERRKIREQVQEKITAFRAKGTAVTMADTKKFLDDVQTIGQGQFDSRYFATMRQIVVQGEQVQNLNKELIQLSSDQSPKANARRAAIMAEMRDSSDRIATGAKSLQSTANDIVKGGQK